MRQPGYNSFHPHIEAAASSSFVEIFLPKTTKTMATECDASKPRRFNRDMSRRTRRSTSLVACYQDRYRTPIALHLPQNAKLKALFHCQETDQLEAVKQCEDAEQRCEDVQMEITLAPKQCEGVVELKVPEQYQDAQVVQVEKSLQYHTDEGQEEIPQEYQDEEQKTAKQHRGEKAAPEQYQDEEHKIPDQYQDEEHKTPDQYQDEGQKAPEQYQDEEQKTPEQDQDEEQKTQEQYQDGEQKTPDQYQDEEEKTPDQYQDEEQKTPEQDQDREQKTQEQYQDEEEKTPDQYQDEEQMTPDQYQDEEKKTPDQDQDEEQKTPVLYQNDEEKTGKQCQEEDDKPSVQHQDEEQKDTEQKPPPEQPQTIKKPITPPSFNNTPRSFSLQELIQEKQLITGDAEATSKFSQGKNAIVDHRAAPGAVATGGTTLAMVIRRPDGGKKSTGVIRRCVKALNQMIKTKHVSKKNPPFKEV